MTVSRPVALRFLLPACLAPACLVLAAGSLGAQEWLELTAHIRAATGQFSVAAVADIDRDGNPDLLLAGGQGDRLLRNTGNALFQDRTSLLPAAPGPTRELLFFDFDGDGDSDLLRLMERATTKNRDRLYRNDGGVFTDVTAAQLPATTPNSLQAVAGDVDGDNDNDLVVATDRGLFLFLNSGAGTFADATTTHLPGRVFHAADVAIADIDGDKDLDLLMANTRVLATTDVIYVNDGSGRFQDATASNYRAVQAPTALHVKVADFDGNQTPDMLLVDNFNFRMVSNNGQGMFTLPAATVPSFRSSPADVELIDIDADGDQDIVTFHHRAACQVFRNNGNWNFADASSLVQGLPLGTIGRVTVADVDGNGRDDLACALLNGRPELFLFEKADLFRNVTLFQTTKDQVSFSVAEAGDMDGDGASDLVTSQGIYLNDGRGEFLGAPLSTAAVGQGHSLVIADLDGDGDQDLYVGQKGTILIPSTTPHLNRLWLNDGKGNLQDASTTNLPPVPDFTNRVRAADIDGDGDLDLLVANENVLNTAPPGVRLLVNNGRAQFSDRTSALLPPQTASTKAILPGDLDGDGRVDLVAVDADGVRAYLQSGNGTFQLSPGSVPSSPAGLVHGDLGDTNGDGRPDLVLSSAGGIAYLLNDGRGVLRAATPSMFPSIPDPVRDMELVDVDDDGRPDVLMSMESGPAGTILLGNNGGTLVDRTSSLSANPFCFSFAVADYDRDGDTDIVLPTNGTGLRMLLNVRRQLHAALPPGLGGRYVLDLHWSFGTAAGSHAVILALSPRPQVLVLPPVGVLGIDTTLMVTLPPRPLVGARGILEHAFPVPQDVRLLALPILAQAILATPEGTRLTNTTRNVVR